MMESRFEEVELLRVETDDILGIPAPTSALPTPSTIVEVQLAARWRRFVALTVDLSLFAALAVAMTPLLPTFSDWETALSRDVLALSGFAAFLLLISYYYFVGCWMIWGKTIGGALLEVRVVSRGAASAPLRHMTQRWVFTLLSLSTGLIPYFPALLRSRLSIADRVSRTYCIRG